MYEDKISIILPAHNASKYIKDAIDSILNQTYTNFELIIIENGSNDGTKDIINSYVDNRIVKIFLSEANLVKALNTGIERSTGKYIARMDADDISEKNRLEKQIQYMTDNPHIDMIGSWVLKINKDNNIIGKYSYHPATSIGVKIFSLISNPFCHPTIMIKSNILRENKYNEKYKHIEDYELWTRILRKYSGVNIPECLLRYRIHEESIDSKHIWYMRFISIKIRFLSLFRILFKINI